MLSRRVFVTMAAAGLARLALPTVSAAQESRARSILGRWDLNVRGEQGEYPAWLEVRRSGSSLVGSFVGQFGRLRVPSGMSSSRMTESVSPCRPSSSTARTICVSRASSMAKP